MKIIEMPIFKKKIKKLHTNQKEIIDKEIRKIAKNPSLGELKKHDLSGLRVHKFHIHSQLILLAYIVINDVIKLIYLDTHENFYRDLKNKDF